MELEQMDFEQLKRENPFTVPEGYMEGLTEQIMNSLPEQKQEETHLSVSFMDRVRPWLYLAAVFAGLGLFFKTFIGGGEENVSGEKQLLVGVVQPVSAPEQEDWDDYLEFLEERYVGSLLVEELAESE